MMENRFDQLRDDFEAVGLPRGARERVLAEARRKDAASAGEAKPGRTMTRRTALGMGLGAAAAAAAVYAGLSFARVDEGHGFTLKAYADGTDQGDGTRLAISSFGRNEAWGVENATDPNIADLETTFDLRVDCDGAESVTYELVGPYARGFEFETDTRWDIQGDTICFEVIHHDQNDATDMTATVTYPYGGIEEARQMRIFCAFEMDDRFREAIAADNAMWETVDASSDEEGSYDSSLIDREVENEARLAGWHLVNQVIAATTLRVTATFTDGVSATKDYVIAPIDDFEEQFPAWLDSKAETTHIPDGEWPALYTITEVTQA